ncbi:NADPH-dependent FMN reductase [Rhodovulum sp. DZ06]|uniref:NADPH-dependent FMN reductase n=1 Tax=Rhodovulum sp. DZ06 TaxID=3425126 RepID=UPI003D343D9E
MTDAPRLLLISGALRKGSTNTMLCREAARVFGDCTTEEADLNLPLFDADLEAEGAPEPVARLVAQVKAADGVIISTPEYNKNLPGVLKNALDWISRDKVDGKMPLAGKPVAILSAASGRAGGERAQFSLRHCLTPFNPRVLQGPEVFVAAAAKAFDEDGKLSNEMTLDLLGKLMAALKAEIELVKG